MLQRPEQAAASESVEVTPSSAANHIQGSLLWDGPRGHVCSIASPQMTNRATTGRGQRHFDEVRQRPWAHHNLDHLFRSETPTLFFLFVSEADSLLDSFFSLPSCLI